jgi:hypothetical protein
MRLATICAAVLALTLVTTGASAETATPSGSAPAASPTDKQAISKACSDQANAQGLHGKARKKFRAACKKRGGAPQ